jgi:hypothetical protein
MTAKSNFVYNKINFLNKDIINFIIGYINYIPSLMVIAQTSKIFHDSLLLVDNGSICEIIYQINKSFWNNLFSYCKNIKKISLFSTNITSKKYSELCEICNKYDISHLKLKNCTFLEFDDGVISFKPKDLKYLTIDGFSYNNNTLNLSYFVQYNEFFTHIHFKNYENNTDSCCIIETLIDACLINNTISNFKYTTSRMHSFFNKFYDKTGILDEKLLFTIMDDDNDLCNMSLKYVSLSGCGQGTYDFIYIMNILAYYAQNIKYIDFSNNKIIGIKDEGTEFELIANDALEVLDLRNNPIDKLLVEKWKKLIPRLQILF